MIKQWPLIVVGGLGLLLLFFANPLAQKLAELRGHAASLLVGRIVHSEGAVTQVHGANSDAIPSPIVQTVEVHSGDRIQTAVDSRTTIILNSSDEFEIGPSSAVQFYLWNERDKNSPIYADLMAGQLTLLKGGVRGKAYVVKEGRLFLPGQTPQAKPLALTVLKNAPLDMQLATAPKRAESADDGEEATTEVAGASASGTEPDTLSNEYIDETIATHQSQLQKCWLTQLKDSPESKGTIVVQLEITKRGKVREARVADASLNDDTLQKCVLSVIERIPFRPFKGAEISLSYPINFE